MTGRVWGGRTEAAPPLDHDVAATSELPVVRPDDVTELIPRIEDAESPTERTMLLEPVAGPEYEGLFREPETGASSAASAAPRSRSWGAASLADEVFGNADVPARLGSSPAPAPRAWRGKTTADVRAEREASMVRAKRKNKRLNVLVTAFALVLALAGGTAIWQGMQMRQIDAPLPDQSMSQCAPPNCKPTGETGTKPVDVVLDDGTLDDGWSDGSDGAGGSGNDKGSKKGTMAVASMANSSVFVPALGAYAPVLGTNQTKESRHAGWQTLMIPTNPRKVSWYSAGADLAGGTQGTTLLAGHIAYNGVNGSFRWLANAKVGNLVYTKNANGATQKWVVDKVFYREQTDFPQSYWSAEGPRQLVMVTCGGPFRNGHYEYNVFVSAVPID